MLNSSIYTNYVNVHLSIDKLDGTNYDTWASNIKLWLKSQGYVDHCTVLVVGSDDVAASYYAGVLCGAHGWRKGRKSGGSCGRQLLSWRAPISSMPKLAVTEFGMKSPDANPDDLVVRDRRNKDIAEDEVR